jgi:3-(3-hydroxy-phenyl)propionate hydroxylase
MPDRAAAAVAVVGAGPVGLVAAVELARRGVRPVVLDAKAEIAPSSRAICISRRSQEILDRIGAGPAFAAKALPWSRGRTFHRGRLVFRLELPHAPGDRHAPFVNLQQFHTERFLLEALQAAGGEVRWGHAVVGAAQDADGVSLLLQGGQEVRADWVVAADGGRSALREAFGLPLRGTSYEGRYLIADIAVEGADRPVERHVWFDPPSNPGSTVILHVQPDGVWRIDCQLRDGEDAEEALREANALARLRTQLDAMGVRAPWRLLWTAVYRTHCLTLDDYRHGRVLFAGDAAHLVPIFGVRGLNSGIDDAHNLGWKLAMVARGEAPAALLDSYTPERRGAALENIAQAAKSTWFMSPPGPGFRLMRDAALSLAAGHPWASALADPRQASAHTYADSPAIVPGRTTAGDGGVPPGAPLPNAPALLSALGGAAVAGHLHDALPPAGFALLAFTDALGPDALAGLLAATPLADVPLRVVPIGAAEGLGEAMVRVRDLDGALAERFAARAFPLYLVRPDEHVAARFRSAEFAPIADALATALGQRLSEARPPSPPAVPEDHRAGALGRDGLERVFEAISREAGAGGDAFLARLALLLAAEAGDAASVLALVAAASDAGR